MVSASGEFMSFCRGGPLEIVRERTILSITCEITLKHHVETRRPEICCHNRFRGPSSSDLEVVVFAEAMKPDL